MPVAPHAGEPGLQVEREVASLEQALALEKLDGRFHRTVEVRLAGALEPRGRRTALGSGIVQ